VNKIIDQFTNLKVSRQRKWQLRKKVQGKCQECGEPVVYSGWCYKHYVYHREVKRKSVGNKRRYLNSPGYKILTTANPPNPP
jgi:sulfatase maturation enzyme AslB (radical SAM superfamily)